MEGFDAVVKSLVNHGCKTDVRNEFGKTALHYLAMKNHAAAIIDIGHAGMVSEVIISQKGFLGPFIGPILYFTKCESLYQECYLKGYFLIS